MLFGIPTGDRVWSQARIGCNRCGAFGNIFFEVPKYRTLNDGHVIEYTQSQMIMVSINTVVGSFQNPIPVTHCPECIDPGAEFRINITMPLPEGME